MNEAAKGLMLIILDYRNARVVVRPLNYGPHQPTNEDYEALVSEWADANQSSLQDCNWMIWAGTIEVTKW